VIEKANYFNYLLNVDVDGTLLLICLLLSFFQILTNPKRH
jgi:hypothetical protein